MTGPEIRAPKGVDPNTTDWRPKAICKDMTDIFFPEHSSLTGSFTADNPAWDLPRSICNACPVKLECREWALATQLDRSTRQGMAGGWSPKERHAEQKRRAEGREIEFFPCDHPRTEENTVKNGKDVGHSKGRCRICVAATNRRAYEKRKAMRNDFEAPIARAVPRLPTKR